MGYDETAEYGAAETDEHAESCVEVEISKGDLPGIDDELYEVDFAEPEPALAEVLQEETDVLQDEFFHSVNESETIVLPFEMVNESIEPIVEGDENLQKDEALDMTKERYELLTDYGKVEWLGIAECSVQDAIQKFMSKLDSIGVVHRYSDDMLDEFMRLESVVAQMGQQHNNERRKNDSDKERSR
jgi:hypothetical protein